MKFIVSQKEMPDAYKIVLLLYIKNIPNNRTYLTAYSWFHNIVE